MKSWQECVTACAGAAWTTAVLAQPAAEMELPSCVSGSPPLRVAAAADRAALDGADRKRFHEAAQARYPLYQRGGFVPAEVLMLRAGRQWQYVTLSNGLRSRPCFTAVFAAERFDFTNDWIAKYKPRAGDFGD
jgi:hypothetical protein